MTAQMVAGGRQQAAGVEQVAVADAGRPQRSDINQATVQSLEGTRQAENAARELNNLARSLAEIVEQYQL